MEVRRPLYFDGIFSDAVTAGVKGAGEGGITAAGAALANAVSMHSGVEFTKLPLKTGLFVGIGEKGRTVL